MNMFSKLRDNALEVLMTSLGSCFLLFFLRIGEKISRKTLSLCCFWSLAINIVLITTLIYFKQKQKLLLKNGVYWDKNKNPHCNKCKSPLTFGGSDFYEQNPKSFWCTSCRTAIYPVDSNGKYIEISKINC